MLSRLHNMTLGHCFGELATLNDSYLFGYPRIYKTKFLFFYALGDTKMIVFCFNQQYQNDSDHLCFVCLYVNENDKSRNTILPLFGLN